MKFKLLRRAVRDLVDIANYLEFEQSDAAPAIIRRIQASFDLIATKPDIGRLSSDVSGRNRIREWSIPGLPYVIPYRVRGEWVEILRVFHTARLRSARWIG